MDSGRSVLAGIIETTVGAIGSISDTTTIADSFGDGGGEN
jgi:hypothetical protein